MAWALSQLRPGSQWAINGEAYSNIRWMDATQKKPTNPELQSIMRECQTSLETRSKEKQAALLLLKNSKGNPNDKINALILLLDLDK